MRALVLSRFALTISTATTLLAGCGSASQPPFVSFNAMRYDGEHAVLPTAGRGYKVLYNFQGIPDAGYPYSGLTMVNGTFYGTAPGGSCCGTVFKITPSGTEQVIYEFKGGSDGDGPMGNLINVKGTLYGVTVKGGRQTGSCSYYGCGTVFKVSTAGDEHVLYRFKGGDDANYSLAGLTLLNGVLYGTSDNGGGYYGMGTVFAVTLTGREKVLYRFKGGASDGAGPQAPLVAFRGKLYGTTASGGCNQCDGRGTVFSISTSGIEHMLYAFQGAGSGKDGATPEAGLIAIGNVLYGTTVAGGFDKTRDCGRSSGHGLGGCGTIFSITPAGKEQILHRFKGKPDGNHPADALVAVDGKLYGTTFAGGVGLKYSEGYGTAFQMTVSGQERVLYRFAGVPDGSAPFGNLTEFNGKLYGTTELGGDNCTGFSPPGCGTVFELSP